MPTYRKVSDAEAAFGRGLDRVSIDEGWAVLSLQTAEEAEAWGCEPYEELLAIVDTEAVADKLIAAMTSDVEALRIELENERTLLAEAEQANSLVAELTEAGSEGLDCSPGDPSALKAAVGLKQLHNELAKERIRRQGLEEMVQQLTLERDAALAPIEPTGTSQCQNCQQIWADDQLKPVKDLEMRVDPGERLPTGECPDCGAVCHTVEN